jgi:SAM-dependent methyltransferase
MPSGPRGPAGEADEIAAFLATAGVTRGARILDAPCGIGRRAFALAERGYRVTAADPNEIAIGALQARIPAELAAHLEFRHASRETLPGPPVSEPFDLILCLDHAMGRGPSEEDTAFLERLRGHLAPGGFLLLDLLQRDFFASRPRPFAYHVVAGLEQHEFRTFNPITGALDLTWKFYQQEGKDLRFRGSSSAHLRLLAPHEARQLLQEGGWHLEAVYGGWGREAVSPDRRKLILVARPAARVK